MMEHQKAEPGAGINEQAETPLPSLAQRITLTDVLIALGEEKIWFLGIWLLGTVVAIAVAFSLPRLYSASTLVLPPQQQQSNAAGALAQLGALAGAAGGAMGVKTPDEMYVAFLKTQNLQANLVSKLKLKDRYQLASLEDTRYKLSSAVQVSSDKKTGLISIVAEDQDPVFAAELANAHVSELRAMLSKLAVTEAQQRRVFFDQQVAKAQEDLRLAETRFRKEQDQNGFVVVQALAESGVRSQIDLQSQIAARDVQIKALSRFMTPQSQEIRRLNAEVGALRQQLSLIQGGLHSGGNDVESSHLGAMKAYREMKVQEASLEVLVRQLEVAKLDEAKDGPLLQQVDIAVPPEFPSKPKRLFLVAAPSLLSFLIGIVVAYVRWSARLRLTNPIASQKLHALKRAWF